MKRLFTLCLAILCFQFTSNAQMANGSVVPNFTVTDIEGNEHELYDILDQGYTVVIDVFATWCGPCWSYHQTHTLEDVWETYGPNGTQEIFVMAIEADATTTNGDLLGTGSSTLGNWTNGITYPMVDDGSMAELLEIAYFPTIYHICQNRIITEAGQLSNPAAFANLGGDCQLAAGANNAAVLAYNGYEGAVCGELDYAPSITIQNLGTETMTAATVEMSINGTVEQTIDWTGNLATYQLEEISFESTMLTGANDVVISLVNVNGADDEDNSNDEVTATINAATTVFDNTVNVRITTDDYGAETYWAFLDAAGNIVADGGNPEVGLTNNGPQPPAHPDAYDNATTYNEEVVLPDDPDCYEFVIADYYGDGICCAYGNGSYEVTTSGGEIIAEGGEFEALDSTPFERAWPLSADEVEIATNLNIFPNPVSELMNVTFDLPESTQLSVVVYNAVGQVVKSLNTANYTAGNHTLAIDVADLASGMYMVSMQSDKGSMTQKITVAK